MRQFFIAHDEFKLKYVRLIQFICCFNYNYLLIRNQIIVRYEKRMQILQCYIELVSKMDKCNHMKEMKKNTLLLAIC